MRSRLTNFEGAHGVQPRPASLEPVKPLTEAQLRAEDEPRLEAPRALPSRAPSKLPPKGQPNQAPQALAPEAARPKAAAPQFDDDEWEW